MAKPGIRQISYNGSVIAEIHVISVKVNPNANITREPIESGVQIADNKVRNPRSITVSVYINGEDKDKVFDKLEAMYNDPLWNAAKGCPNSATIETSWGKYENMVLTSNPHEENGTDKFEHYYFDLEFSEVLYQKSVQTVVPVEPADKSTKSAGTAPATKTN